MRTHLFWAAVLSVAAIGINPLETAGSTIWSTTTVPTLADSGPDSGVELGVKFRADSSGYITGIRFYKGTGNTGTHVANLWSASGALLATATFNAETATGWQEVAFATPIAITANTVYVASYHTNTGHYSADQNYFAGKGAGSSPLFALAEGVSGTNGVYAYGSTSVFPSSGWLSSNYWVDVVFTAVAAAGSTTIWPATTVPTLADSGPDSAVELGVKFRADSSGYIAGIRFYKGAGNTGTHVANLWSASGALLATATFNAETATGWQEVAFATPIAITANMVYVASYHTNTGHYSADQNYFAGKGAGSTLLFALAEGVSGANGVYAYGPTSVFPSSGWQSSNYWVDVVFTAGGGGGGGDSTAPTVTSFTVPASVSSLTVPITSFTATDNVGVTGYLVTESASAPASSAIGWLASASSSYIFTSAGSKTLYGWAKDAAGNVSKSSSASVTVTPSATGVEPAGWYPGDMHVHRSCGSSPQSVSSIFQKMNDQNLSVISLLADMGNGEVKNPATDLPLVNGNDASVSTAGKILHWDTEWHWDPTFTQYAHRALGGHIVALGLSHAEQVWQEYTYPILQWAHQQNGIAGFAHMQYLDNNIPQQLTCCTPIEYPVEVALGASDFISEDVDQSGGNYSFFADAPIQAYYRLLNCGFRPGLAAGTDAPCNDGSAPGALLTYVQVAGGDLTYRNWINGIAAGRTVVSRNGHREFISLIVNGSATPGDEIRLSGTGSVQVAIEWTANNNFSGTIELVQNGVVVASRQASVSQGAPAALTATVPFAKSGWLAARRMGSDGHQVHTAAVFVVVDGAPIRASAEDAHFYVQWMDNLLQKTSPGGAWNNLFINNLSEAQARYQAAKAVFQQIESEAAGGTPPPASAPSIFTSQTPTAYENDASYELGAKFWADVAGQITQVRIYTGAAEGGTHTVRIWRVSDQALVAGPYSWDIASGTLGWRSFTLPAAVTISANTDYIVSVSNSTDRYYAGQNGGFDLPIVNGNLHTYTGSGVYAESIGTMPALSWQNSNYFRDIVFVPKP